MATPHSADGMRLDELLPDVSLAPAHAQLLIRSLAIDSRLVAAGSLFIAFPGSLVDGRDYIAQAIDAGAVAIVAEARSARPQDVPIPVIMVNDLSAQVSVIASRFYGQPSKLLQVTGFTGTNGKTTCTQLLAQLYHLLGKSAGAIGTLGYGMVGSELTTTGMTTPDALQTQCILADLFAQGASCVAMEVSSHSLDQGRVADVQFHTAVFTNLSRDHLDYHGTFENYTAAKSALFGGANLHLAVVNGDDDVAVSMLEKLPNGVAHYSFSVANPNADVYTTAVQLSDHGIQAQLHTPWGASQLNSTLLGEFNLSNLLAVITAACGQGFALSRVIAAITELTPVSGRMEVVCANRPPSVVVDYAHTPDGLEKALQAMAAVCSGKLWCVFGCGGDRDRGKRAQMAAVASRFADQVVVTSDNPRSENPQAIIDEVLQGIVGSTSVLSLVDRQAAIRYAIAHAEDDDCVLIAGKGHELFQEIKGTKLPFSDVCEARAALDQRDAGGLS